MSTAHDFDWKRDVTTSYTNEDDGIWLECQRCGPHRRVVNLGFWPTVGEIEHAARLHGASHFSGLTHGRISTYNAGCRCEDCTAAARKSQASYRTALKVEGRTGLSAASTT